MTAATIGLSGHAGPIGQARVLATLVQGEARVRATYGANWDRLVEVKRRWDPDNLFRSNRNVRP